MPLLALRIFGDHTRCDYAVRLLFSVCVVLWKSKAGDAADTAEAEEEHSVCIARGQ